MRYPTEHLANLKSALTAMRPLVRGVNPLSCDTPLQALKVRSYILLLHAALEEYLEEVSINIAKVALQNFKSERKISIALLGLISCHLLDEVAIGKAKKKTNQELFNDIEAFSTEALTRLHIVVKENNGIKRVNQLSLLLPIGVNPEQVDSVTLAALDSFGTIRGDIAHKAKIVKNHTLSEVEGEIKTILNGLSLYDQAACDALI